MIRRTLSAGRHGRLPFPSRIRGFSVVELLMSLVLVAIGTALALPSYRDMVEKRQVTNAAEQLASFMNSAQGIAMKRNRDVTIYQNADTDNGWCIGASFGTNACDCVQTNPVESNFCQLECDPRLDTAEKALCLAGLETADRYVINETLSAGSDVIHNVSGPDFYTFDPVRGLVPTGLEEPLTMELRSPSGDFRLNLMVNQVGRVILCSGDSSHAVPGYEPCPALTQEEGA